jgi:hypothetical protein
MGSPYATVPATLTPDTKLNLRSVRIDNQAEAPASR